MALGTKLPFIVSLPQPTQAAPTQCKLVSAPSSTALSSGADGRYADAACGAPEGYQPSAKYCRTSARLPATMGVAMDVPRSIASAHVCKPSGLHCFQGWTWAALQHKT